MSDQPDRPPETLGHRIRKLRAERGMSLAKVAQGDFSRAFLNQVEMGKARPSIRVLRVIANRLQAPVEYLLDGSVPTLDREIAVERARIDNARGDHRGALAAVEPAAESPEWPLGAEARLAKVGALLGLGRRAAAEGLAAEVEAELRARRDLDRLARLQAVLRGRRRRTSVKAHLDRAEELLQRDLPLQALDHYKAARVLLEDGPRRATARPGT
jgi:transcriptional regulator with XRE-family HTH domain